METETVFEVGGEGGSLQIDRQIDSNGIKFIYHHHESYPTDEDLSIHENGEYEDFETPFQIINRKYPWYSLYIVTIHDDFKDYIKSQLIQKLNHEDWSHQRAGYFQSRLEEALQIKLGYKEKDGWYFM